MKILLDQGLPRSAAELLRARGFDVRHTGDVKMAQAADGEIIAAARAMGWTIVTLDADFHAILALSNVAAPSVIRIRMEKLKAPEVAAIVERVIQACRADLESGAMVTVDGAGIRVRALPLVRLVK